jgi:hypothetical protein
MNDAFRRVTFVPDVVVRPVDSIVVKKSVDLFSYVMIKVYIFCKCHLWEKVKSVGL